MRRFNLVKSFFFALLCMAVGTYSNVSVAQSIDADVSGSWFAPEQSGHGLQLELLDLGRVVVTWYAYDDVGEPIWLLGVGQAGGQVVEASLYAYRGAHFPPNFDPQHVQAEHWGDIRFELAACNRAKLEYDPIDTRFEAGNLELHRLTRIDGLHCHAGDHLDTERGWRFDTSVQGFEALFLDYPEGEEAFYQLDWRHEALPEPWDQRSGIRISGSNHSDDLMMVLMRPIDGFQPDSEYQLELSMQFATNVPSRCVGVGGSPGESVFMKLGASSIKPEPVLEDSADGQAPMRRPNIDLGNQSQPGERALVVGDMANGLSEDWCSEDERPWQLKRVSTAGQDFRARSDENGRLWVYGLSDSGFEAVSTWYLTEFRLRYRQL